jgi:chondroitin 4-sulfotransferase 11
MLIRGLANYLKTFEHPGGIIISEEKKFIYMKPTKTAGTSILRHVLEAKIPDIIHFKDHREKILLWRENLTDEQLSEYFIFAFTRNPWDRIVSSAFYLKIPVDQFLLNYNNYIKKFKARIHSLPIHFYTHLKETYFVNYLGRFETLQEDFDIICDRIGIERTVLPHINKTEHKHYSMYYNLKTKSLVEQIYYKDIKFYNYRFEYQ